MIVRPIKVTFDLASPVVSSDKVGIHLDGLIAYALVQETLEAAGSFEAALAGLGEVIEEDGSGVYCASLLEFASEGDMFFGITRRTDDFGIATARENFDLNGHRVDDEDFISNGAMVADFDKSGTIAKSMRGDAIDLASGKLRNFQLFLPAMQCRHVVGWCIGDPDRIQDLLSRHILHIGRKGAAGFGVVKRVTVEEDGEALSLWCHRAMPHPVEGYVPIVGNIRPPYWRADQRVAAWIPA